MVPKAALAKNMAVARWSGIIVGVLGIMMALVLATWNIASLWDQFNTFLGMLTGGLGALFVMGIFFPRISGNAALLGVVGGLFVLVLVKNHTDLSFLLYGFVSLCCPASCLLGWPVGCFLTGRLSLILPGKVSAFKCRGIIKQAL